MSRTQQRSAGVGHDSRRKNTGEDALWAALFSRAEKAGDKTLAFRYKTKWNHFEIPKPGTSEKRGIDAPDALGKGFAKDLDKWMWDQWSPTYEFGFTPFEQRGSKFGTGTPATLDELRIAIEQNEGDILSLDMSKAFHNVSAKTIWEQMKRHGFSKAVRRRAIALGTKQGRLVMGSPIAPQLFAMCVEPALREIEERLNVVRIIAYADDVYIVAANGSADSKASRRKFVKEAKSILWNTSYQKLNTSKTKWFSKTSNNHALGAVLTPSGGVARARKATEARRVAAERAVREDRPWISSKGQPIPAKSVLASMNRYRDILEYGKPDIFGESLPLMGATRRGRELGLVFDHEPLQYLVCDKHAGEHLA